MISDLEPVWDLSEVVEEVKDMLEERFILEGIIQKK